MSETKKEIPKELKDKINRFMAITKENLVAHGQTPWTVLFNTLDGRCFTAQAYFENEKDKVKDLKYLFTIMRALGAKSYYVACESWSIPETKRIPGREVRLHFQKKSTLMVLYVSEKYKLSKTTLVKKIDDKFTFDDDPAFNQTGGRMTTLIDFESYKDRAPVEKMFEEIPYFGQKEKEEMLIETAMKHSTLQIKGAPSEIGSAAFYE